MSILDIAMQDVPEVKNAPAGEHQVEIAHAEEKVFNSGRAGLSIRLTILDEPDCESIFHNVMYDMEGDSDSTKRMMILGTKNFVESFDITSNDPEDYVGKRAWAVTDLEEYEGQERAVVKKFMPAQ